MSRTKTFDTIDDRNPPKPAIALCLLASAALFGCNTGAKSLNAGYSSSIVVDTGAHIGKVWRADVNENAGIFATTSDDKSVRLWRLNDGDHIRSFRFPTSGPRSGKLYAVDINPSGNLIATAGTAVSTEDSVPIYIIESTSGKLLRRICCVGGSVYHLEFSPDGKRLAVAVTGEESGIRIYNVKNGWAELVSVTFEQPSYSLWLSHASDGRLAVSSFGNGVLLFDKTGGLIAQAHSLSGEEPVAVAFNPKSDKLAVGYFDRLAVDLLDGTTLERVESVDISGIGHGSLSKVAWSADGEVLYAAGNAVNEQGVRFFAWSEQGLGNRTEWAAGEIIASALIPLRQRDLLIITQEPTIRRMSGFDTLHWSVESEILRIANTDDAFQISADGNTIQLRSENGLRHFDVSKLQYQLGSQEPTLAPRTEGLDITNWQQSREPMLKGKPLEYFGSAERSLSLAIDATADRFVLGSDWHIRFFSATGSILWESQIEAGAYQVNISQDGSRITAALYDGTIRWYDSQNGNELLALFPYQDIESWVAWTPSGFVAASDKALSSVRELRRGNLNQLPESILVNNESDRYQPSVVSAALGE